MTSSRPAHEKIYAAVGLAGFAFLVGYVLTRTRAPFFDEVWHLTQAERLGTSPDLRDWLVGNKVSSVGPLYGLLYAPFAQDLPWPIPWLRLPNLLFLGLTLFVLGAICRRRDAPAAAWGVMAVPMIWVVGGMALTELPAIAMLALAIFAADQLGEPGATPERGKRMAWWVLFGAAFGLAVATRQNALALTPALLLLAAPQRRDIVPAALALGLGLAPMIVVFGIWGGLVPPGQAHVGRGLNAARAMAGCVFLAAPALLLAPRWWWAQWRWAAGGAAAAMLGSSLLGGPALTMLSSAQRWLANPALARVLERAFAFVGVGLAGAFVVLLAREAWLRRDRATWGAVAGVAAICASCAMVTHQFSSRYVTLALPFLVPLLARAMDFGPWAWVRCGAGAAAGFAALHSYYTLG